MPRARSAFVLFVATLVLPWALVACAPPAEPSGGDDAGDGSPGTTPGGGTVGPTGGTVDRLLFAFHGDTRPPNCDQTSAYPTKIINSIFRREAQAGVQFTVDLGDHMFVCSNQLATAQAQMKYYTDAAKTLPVPTFMTMGNHECGGADFCPANSPSANMQAYMAALTSISPLPYYSFDVTTKTGKATFVIVADNAWDSTQEKWLVSTLTEADKSAKYTIVVRHHPIDNKDVSGNQTIWGIVSSHKYTLFLTGHSHLYSHDTYLDKTRRTLRMGCGGAPLDPGATWNGYGTVQQGMDDKLYVTVYDVDTNMPQDSWSVSPQ
jgi:hypothetical protein